MQTCPSAVDRNLQLETGPVAGLEVPTELPHVRPGVFNLPKNLRLAFVPQHRLTKRQPERHLVFQRLKSARRCAGTGEVSVHPGPEIAMPVATIVALETKPQRPAFKPVAIENNLAG